MLSILPIFSSFGNPNSREIGLKYFISQRVASIFFLLFIFITFYKTDYFSSILTILILFKIGIPPFSSWMVRISLSSPFKILFLIFSIQKFIPLHIFRLLQPFFDILNLAIVWSIFRFFSILKNLSNMRLILILSAWSNSLWIIFARPWNNFWLIYLIFYSFLLFLILSFLHFNNINKFSRFVVSPFLLKFFCFLNFLNMAGLPPFSGFFFKVVLLKSFLALVPLFCLMALLLFSLLTLGSYIFLSFYRISAFFSRQYFLSGSNFFVIFFFFNFFLLAFPIFTCLRI